MQIFAFEKTRGKNLHMIEEVTTYEPTRFQGNGYFAGSYSNHHMLSFSFLFLFSMICWTNLRPEPPPYSHSHLCPLSIMYHKK